MRPLISLQGHGDQIFQTGPLGVGGEGRPRSPLVLRKALMASVAALRSYAVIASMSVSTRTMLSTRVKLYVSTQSAIYRNLIESGARATWLS
jgi:hypothetical protein